MSRLMNPTVIVLAAVALLIVLAPPASAQGRSPSFFQADNLFVPGAGFDPVGGAGALTRTQQDISFRVHASELDPGAYTLWAIIFNRPENCAPIADGGPGLCRGPDLNNPDVAGSGIPVSGAIVGDDGVANFFGSVREGDAPEGLEVNPGPGTVNGLRDTLRAEIHLVVRDHGGVDAELSAAQLTTLGGGCPPCANVRAVIFEPVM